MRTKNGREVHCACVDKTEGHYPGFKPLRWQPGHALRPAGRDETW